MKTGGYDLKKLIIFALVMVLAITLIACSSRSVTQSGSENTTTPSLSETSTPQAPDNEANNLDSTSSSESEIESSSPISYAENNIKGVITIPGDERYNFISSKEVGTEQDLQNMSYLVADIKNEVTDIFITNRDIEKERELSKDEVENIISILQFSPIKTFESMGNPATGGIDFNLVACDANGEMYLHIVFDDYWVVCQMKGNDRVFVFDGENNGMYDIGKIIES